MSIEISPPFDTAPALARTSSKPASADGWVGRVLGRSVAAAFTRFPLGTMRPRPPRSRPPRTSAGQTEADARCGGQGEDRKKEVGDAGATHVRSTSDPPRRMHLGRGDHSLLHPRFRSVIDPPIGPAKIFRILSSAKRC